MKRNYITRIKSRFTNWLESLAERLDISDTSIVRVTHIFLVVLFLFSILLTFIACSTPKSLIDTSTSSSTQTTDSTSTSKDSVKTITVVVRDTIYLDSKETSSDSTSTKSSSTSSIKFGESGGTYNTKTGEATNVVSVDLTDEFTQLQSSYKESQEKLSAATSTITTLSDSISTLNTQLKSASTQQTNNNIQEKTGLSKLQQTFIYMGIIFLIIYTFRIILKIVQIFQPGLSLLNKILSWLP